MIREEVFSPLVGPIGALGISTETSADLGKERRTTTKAPPAEMLMAVANSSESLPLPSRARTKTGMASRNRVHFRSSFFDKLRGTCNIRQSGVLALVRPHLMGQTWESTKNARGRSKPRHWQANYPSSLTRPDFRNDYRSHLESATFFAFRLFPIDSRVHLTYDQPTPLVRKVVEFPPPIQNVIGSPWLRHPTKALPLLRLARLRKIARRQ